MGSAAAKKKAAARSDGGLGSPPVCGIAAAPPPAAYALPALAAMAAVVTFLVYLPVLGNGFINWDDRDYVTVNPDIRLLNLHLIRWAFGFHAANWHPLTWISHAVDVAVWGMNPLGHHLTSVLLHTANTYLVVILAATLLRAGRRTAVQTGAAQRSDERALLVAAALTGLLFGVHPLHVESVAWVAERKDLICALFTLLALLAYTRNAAGETSPPRFNDRRTLLVFGFFLLALLAKPMAVTLPVVLLLLDWYPLGRLRSAAALPSALRAKLPFFALSVASSILTLMAQKAGGAMALMAVVPLGTRLSVAADSLTAYLVQMALPLRLSPYHPYPPPTATMNVLTILVVVGITLLCLRFSRRRPWYLAAWAFYVVTLLPVLGIVQVGGQAMADRYTYLPSLGPFILVGLGVATLPVHLRLGTAPGRQMRLAAVIACVTMVIPLCWATVNQIAIWRDSFTFWDQVIRRVQTPIAFAHVNRGAALMGLERFEEALADFQRAGALDPSDSLVYANLGIALERLGRPDEALAALDRALAMRPDLPQTLNDRGSVLVKLGRVDEAIASFDAAVARDPGFDQAWYNRGVALGGAGRFEESVASFDRALAIDPRRVDAYVSRGVSHGLLGRLDGALADFEVALRLDPGHGPAHYNRGNLRRLRGDREGARRDFEQACAAGDSQGCAALR
jgi:Flp pilus assembly protein TadD